MRKSHVITVVGIIAWVAIVASVLWFYPYQRQGIFQAILLALGASVFSPLVAYPLWEEAHMDERLERPSPGRFGEVEAFMRHVRPDRMDRYMAAAALAALLGAVGLALWVIPHLPYRLGAGLLVAYMVLVVLRCFFFVKKLLRDIVQKHLDDIERIKEERPLCNSHHGYAKEEDEI